MPEKITDKELENFKTHLESIDPAYKQLGDIIRGLKKDIEMAKKELSCYCDETSSRNCPKRQK